MSRYGHDRKESTRHAIVAAAGRRLKLDGIDGSGVTTLMKDAGLTNGAFYAHFSSKDELVATAIADQLARQRTTLRAVATDRAESKRSSASTFRPNIAMTAAKAAHQPLCSTKSLDAQ